jgi:hypothetical protein
VNRVDRTFWAAVATGDGNETIQERVRGMRGLESWRGPKVVGRGINRLAARECRDHVRRPVTKPERGHVDEGTVVGLECQAQVEIEDAVSAEERPVAAARQQLSAELRTLEVTVRCNRCGGDLIQRIDDNAETVRKRLKVYEQETRPLLEYYSSRPTFHVVNGGYPPEQVAEKVAAILDLAAADVRLRQSHQR